MIAESQHKQPTAKQLAALLAQRFHELRDPRDR
jgi:hypothetical protein